MDVDEENKNELKVVIDRKAGVEYTTKYTDMVLVVDGNEIPVHRQVLALRSEYFATMFYGEFEDNKKNRIHIKDMKWSPFKKIIELIYSGKVNAVSKELPEMYVVAHMFGLTEVMEEIIRRMCAIVLPHHFVLYTNFAYEFDVPDLKRELNEVWYEVFNLNKDDTGRLSEAAIVGLLCYEMEPDDELCKFQLALIWLQANGDSKAQMLMSKINLSNFTIEEIRNRVRPSGYFTDKQIIDAIL